MDIKPELLAQLNDLAEEQHVDLNTLISSLLMQAKTVSAQPLLEATPLDEQVTDTSEALQQSALTPSQALSTSQANASIPLDKDWLSQKLPLSLFQSILDGVVVLDDKFRIVYCDNRCSFLFQVTPDEMIGEPLDRLMSLSLEEKATTWREDSLSPMEVTTASGDVLHLAVRVVPLFNHGLPHFLVLVNDVSVEYQLRQDLLRESDLLRQIMDASPAGINVVDKTGYIMYANRRSEEILGATAEELNQRTYDDDAWKHTDYEGNPWHDEQQPFVRVMKTGKPVWDVRHAIEWQDGRRVFLSINGMPIFDHEGNVDKVVFTIEDYTERKNQQEALEASLEREKQLNHIKTRFLSVVAHEFRTPMAIIMTATGLLRLKAEKEGSVEKEFLMKRLTRMEEQLQRLDALIQDVTYMNKHDVITHTRVHSLLDLGTFLRTHAQDIRSVYSNHSPIYITHPTESIVLTTDISLMDQIITNLFSNAMKYSPDGDVFCEYYVEQSALGKQVVVVVKDTGLGIPENEQKNLFEPFHRANNVRSIMGTGLGLSIVKHSVDSLAGTITIESKEAVGTTVTLTLPIGISDLYG